MIYESDYVDGEVYVLVTTVSGERVYCVDVVKNIASLKTI